MILWQQGTLSPHVVDYHVNILKQKNPPAAPKLPQAVSLRFHDKNRDRFLELVQEAHQSRHWTQKIITESMKQGAGAAMVAPA